MYEENNMETYIIVCKIDSQWEKQNKISLDTDILNHVLFIQVPLFPLLPKNLTSWILTPCSKPWTGRSWKFFFFNIFIIIIIIIIIIFGHKRVGYDLVTKQQQYFF